MKYLLKIAMKLANAIAALFYYFALGFKHWNDTKGTASRREFWSFMLTCWAFDTFARYIDGATDSILYFGNSNGETLSIGMYTFLFMSAYIIPTITLMVRRLHDSNHSGWFALIGLIPVLGFFVMCVFASLKTHPQSRWAVKAEVEQQSEGVTA